MQKTLGGDRLGSGGKIKVHLHNYGRSTHNLSRAWRSSMAPGTLVPFLVEPALNGDTFDININSLVRTLPTIAPLFGSFKLQADVFCAPIRLYNKQLHNNKLNIGLNMEKVIFPKITLAGSNPAIGTPNPNSTQINQSSLMAYLGIRGLGREIQPAGTIVTRDFNAMPLLAYWDIFKNYYANKQETNAYVIQGAKPKDPQGWIQRIQIKNMSETISIELTEADKNRWFESLNILNLQQTFGEPILIRFHGINITADNIMLGESYKEEFKNEAGDVVLPLRNHNAITQLTEAKGYVAITLSTEVLLDSNFKSISFRSDTRLPQSLTDIKIQSFPLSNIDDMRERILEWENTSPMTIGQSSIMEPYATYVQGIWDSQTNSQYMPTHNIAEMAGLALKTYQSDRFNNWLSTEWIEGANGIAAVTAIDTSSGSFTMDTLNLAQKVYNMLNRIAVSGGSYVDWQEAVYGEIIHPMPETPFFCGGMSSEIVFGEVTSTAEASEEQPLGTLAGKGYSQENGKSIVIRVQEPSYIIGILSLTPRVDYSQGNKWWTRLETMNDLHKPALDGIGFQELITDEMAAWDTIVTGPNVNFFSAGKQPAWIHYQTAVNETYGNFAEPTREMYMTLNRKYEQDETGRIKDLTTYIDPEKYNYAFARTDLGAQNFWVQLGIECIARRKMSATQIPNL